MSDIDISSSGMSRRLNDLARRQFVHKVYEEILADRAVCLMEGWDTREFIEMLRDVLDEFEAEEKSDV